MNHKGEEVIRFFAPPNAYTNHDGLSLLLISLVEVIMRNGLQGNKEGFYGLGGRFGYGAEFENETFKFHQNTFIYKPSNFEVKWYKWIGRSMEYASVCGRDFISMAKACMNSLPQEAVKLAVRQNKKENSPKAIGDREKREAALTNLLLNPKEHGAPEHELTCSQCGTKHKVFEWGTSIIWTCNSCLAERWEEASIAAKKWKAEMQSKIPNRKRVKP